MVLNFLQQPRDAVCQKKKKKKKKKKRKKKSVIRPRPHIAVLGAEIKSNSHPSWSALSKEKKACEREREGERDKIR